MSGLFNRPKTPPPETIPGFEFVQALAEMFGNEAAQNISQLNAPPGFESLGQIGPLLEGLTRQFMNVGQPALQEGLTTGFMPDILADVEASLLPARGRAVERLGGDVREFNANLGTLTSTGTGEQFTRGVADIESGVQATLGQIMSQLAGNAQGIRERLTSLPFQGILGAVDRVLGQSQFAANRPLAAAQSIAGLINAVPLFQQTYGPSKGEQIFNAGTQALAAWRGGSPQNIGPQNNPDPHVR